MINRKLRHTLGTLLVLPVAVLLAYTPAASAQNYTPLPRAQAQAAFSQQALDQMLAPIALYPDSLLSQILMASTYPLEVVEAARWSRAYPGLTGDRAVRAVERMDWDPSVKSLAAFPEILAMMDEKLNWTESLGDAFLAQEPQVMDSVQYLRQKAYAAGNLRSNEWMRVQTQGLFIAVEPLDPRIIYVPYYDPLVVYGPWWWPAYQPVRWAPWHGYYARPGFVGFAWGTGIPVSVGFFFGTLDWPRHHTRVVNVNNYYYSPTVVVNRQINVNNVTRNVNIAPDAWQHDPAHRRGAPYREASLRERFGGAAEIRVENHAREFAAPAPHANQGNRADAAAPTPRVDAKPEVRPEPRSVEVNRRDARDSSPRADARPEARAEAPRSDHRPDAIASVGNRAEIRASRLDSAPAAAVGRPDPPAARPNLPSAPAARPHAERPSHANETASQAAAAPVTASRPRPPGNGPAAPQPADNHHRDGEKQNQPK